MVSQKTITETKKCSKRNYNVFLQFDGESDPKKTKILSDDSWNRVDYDKDTRAAMIKSRFAETIFKYQREMILKQNNGAEKKILEKKKADVEAKIRASKMLLRIQRQKEREAARAAINKIQRTIEWNDACQVTNEFHKLIGVHTLFSPDQFRR